jgi:hypothetical protein
MTDLAAGIATAHRRVRELEAEVAALKAENLASRVYSHDRNTD